LNAGLGFLLFVEQRRYTMTPAQERTILAVLQQNHIIMDTRIVRQSPPMRTLNVSGHYYNIGVLLDIFFDGNAIQEESLHHQYLFRCEAGGQLTISNGFIGYENLYGFRQWGQMGDIGIEGRISQSVATSLANSFVKVYFPDFHIDVVFDDYDEHDGEYTHVGVRVIYLQQYRGRPIHSNFIELLVTPVGITQIEMQFGRVYEHIGMSRMIFAPDEVLLTFAQRVNALDLNEENLMVITHMDLVYLQENASDSIGSMYPAEPFYRIFIKGHDVPFLINAFTNVLLE